MNKVESYKKLVLEGIASGEFECEKKLQEAWFLGWTRGIVNAAAKELCEEDLKILDKFARQVGYTWAQDLY